MPKQTSTTDIVPRFPAGDLIDWYKNNGRDLPWRNTSDPYRIWVSEVMLQQTRVDTVIPYYRRFLDAFPTVQDLASARRQQVLKLWEGLGYYSRARNLQDAARTVCETFDGKLPDTYDEIQSLKGVGPYTASALLSIAFGKPYAVVDGNVIRVISRYYGLRDDVRASRTKKQIGQIAQEILDEANPGDFNQAMMELGATVCTPRSPDCLSCPLSAGCLAYQNAETEVIPYSSPAKKVPRHQIGVGLVRDDEGRLLIALRPEDVMLGGLWEFPGGKKKNGESIRETIRRELKEELGIDVSVHDKFHELDHAYSHFKINLHAYWCTLLPGSAPPEPKKSREIRWVPAAELEEFPFPKANKVLTAKLLKLENRSGM